MQNTKTVLGLTLLLLAACTSVKVEPVPVEHQIPRVVIRTNSKVLVTDFVDTLVKGFHRHGIATKVVSELATTDETYVVTYVAFRKWDLAAYLTDATISVFADGVRVGHAVYHLTGGGGLALNKWAGTESKIGPVMDELLQNQAAVSE